MTINKTHKTNKALSMLLFAIICIIANIIISVTASYFFNSIILKIYGFVTIVDLMIFILLFKGSQKSINTPDLIHNFGFGKYENLAFVISSILLPIILIHSIFISVNSIVEGTQVYHTNLFLIIPFIILISSKIKEYLINGFYSNSNIIIFKNLVSKKNNYLSIELIILLSVFSQAFIPNSFKSISLYIDVASAIGLMIYLMYLPLSNLRNSLNQLLDKTLPEEILFDFLSVIIEHFNLMCEYKSMRTRRSGDDIFVDIDIIMPSDISLEKVSKIENSIKNSLNQKYPNAHPRVYAQPCVRNCIYKNNGNCPVLKSDNQIKDLTDV